MTTTSRIAIVVLFSCVAAVLGGPQGTQRPAGGSTIFPPAPEDPAGIRTTQLPDFLKEVKQFNETSRAIAAFHTGRIPDRSMQNNINKKVKALEDHVDRIMDYLLEGGNTPAPPRIPKIAGMAFLERMEMLNTIALGVVQRVQRYIADQQKDVVDAQLESGLIQDLQTLKLIAQALRRPNAREGSGSADEPFPGLRNEATGMEFVQIPSGEFTMGCSVGNRNCEGDEKPAHLVRITKGFEMGIYEVTQAQWESVMGSNPSHFRGANLPVEQVSWNDAQEFLQKLNTPGDGYQYRLPTEAEWEYAARAGTMTLVPGSLDAVAWYSQNSGSQTHPVGQKQPNPWGLYDMIGNVWEWVQDWYDPDYYQSAPATDPAGPLSGRNRSLRGGSWYYVARDGRISYRDYIDPTGGFDAMGFRCVRAAIPAN